MGDSPAEFALSLTGPLGCVLRQFHDKQRGPETALQHGAILLGVLCVSPGLKEGFMDIVLRRPAGMDYGTARLVRASIAGGFTA